MTTKITADNISANSITLDKLEPSVVTQITSSVVSGISVSNIIVTDSNFNNTEDTSISATTGGFLKLLGSGFDQANVFFSNTLVFGSELAANNISSTEIRLTVGVTNPSSSSGPYNLFLINRKGATAIKLSAFTSIVLQPTAGWFGGGGPPSISNVDRITFATDTATASSRGPLSLAFIYTGATGNDNFGWFGGGEPGARTNITRITFANDSVTSTNRGALVSGAAKIAATGNSNFGWFGGGVAPPTTSRVNRVDFAEDTATATARGPLSSAKYALAAKGDDNYGWFGGGAFPAISTVDRIDFAADTNTASVRGPLSSVNFDLGAVTDKINIWFGGGYAPSPLFNISRVERMTMATDTGATSTRGPLTIAQKSRRQGCTGNLDFGWFGGGGPPIDSRVDRITFLNDTVTASARGVLTSARMGASATAGLL